MIGVGADLVDLGRFRAALRRTPALAPRLFTPDELAYAERRRDPAQPLGARFAAKEAVVKALGTGRFPRRDVEVVRDPRGAPHLLLHGAAARLAEELGVTGWRLTLSHTESLAHAVAIALGAQPVAAGPPGGERGRGTPGQGGPASAGRA